MASIGKNIKRLREQNGWSQSELASKIGKSRAAISQYEHDETTPRMGVIENLAYVFDVPKSQIIDKQINYAFINLEDGLTDDEQELIKLFRRLTPKGKHAILAGLKDFIES